MLPLPNQAAVLQSRHKMTTGLSDEPPFLYPTAEQVRRRMLLKSGTVEQLVTDMFYDMIHQKIIDRLLDCPPPWKITMKDFPSDQIPFTRVVHDAFVVALTRHSLVLKKEYAVAVSYSASGTPQIQWDFKAGPAPRLKAYTPIHHEYIPPTPSSVSTVTFHHMKPPIPKKPSKKWRFAWISG